MYVRSVLSAIAFWAGLSGTGIAAESYYRCEFYMGKGVDDRVGYTVKDLRPGESYRHFIGDTLLEASVDASSVYTWIAAHYGEPVQYVSDSLVTFGTKNPNVKLELADVGKDDIYLVKCELK